MGQLKTYSRWYLPHYQPPDATYHVVFRLAGSLPAEVVERLRQEMLAHEKTIGGIGDERRKLDEYRAHQQAHFERFEQLLDGCTTGPRWLQEQELADIVAEAIHYRDKRDYELMAYCIMPNLVHMVFDHAGVAERGSVGRPARQESFSYPAGGRGSSTYSVTSILENLKWYTAQESWTRRTILAARKYDHVVCSGEELVHTIWYVLNNPVKARLVDSWEQWPWTYCKPNLL